MNDPIAGRALAPEGPVPKWPDCVLNFDETEIAFVMDWRKWSHDFCWWLKTNSLIGIVEIEQLVCYGFPVIDEAGRVVRANYRKGRTRRVRGGTVTWTFAPGWSPTASAHCSR